MEDYNKTKMRALNIQGCIHKFVKQILVALSLINNNHMINSIAVFFFLFKQ